VESIFQTHLNLEQDPYLKDHIFNGSYLFPTVFGLEAMAQVAAHATGVGDFSRVRIEDINLKRPIVVDPKEGADIAIWAQVQEQKSDSDRRIVRCGITKLQSGVKADFFSARFVMGLTNEPPNFKIDIPDKPLNIQPKMDLYRPTLLFQGSRFQRIERIWELTAKNEIAEQAIFSSRAEGILKVSEMASPKDLNYDFLLGDPFFRDTLLQSAQLLVPQKTCLPVYIRRLEIYPSDIKKPVSLFAVAKLDHLDEQDINDTVVVVDESGRVVEILKGFTLQILKHHDDYPTATDLICPDHRDNQIVSNMMQNFGQRLNFHVPKLLLRHMPGLHNLDREERHMRELPLLEETITQVTDKYPDEHKSFKIQWLKSGKPVVKGDGIKNVEISVSHDERLCICVAGTEVQGCDIEPIAQRSRAEWSGLLGPQRDKILDLMLKEIDSLNLAGTMIWSAVEALRKVTGESSEELKIIEKKDDFVLFKSMSSELPILIIALPLDLTWGPRRILALVVREVNQHSSQVSQDDPTGYKGYENLFKTRQFEAIKGGPQGQGMFVHRFPVTFKACSQLSRTVYFVNYFFWLGEVREASLWPVMKKVAKQFSTGKWGLVTNNLNMRILGESTAQDQIEIRMWVTGNGGMKKSTMDLAFDFRKILAGDKYERLAWCEQQVTWVNILNHGQVRPESYPAYYWDSMKNILPRYEAPNELEPLPETLGHLLDAEADVCQYLTPSGPVVRSVLHEQIIDTSIDNSNLVGNIYFANYYAWMGQTRDRYFFNLIPEYFRGTGEKGELLCLECRVHHLREAMPFDRIVVTMALKVLNTFSATFYFEYFRREPDGTRLKLAVGEHLAVWVKRDDQGQPIPAPFPQPVLNNFRQVITAN
jgi:acyl-CoA thioesterase FadM